MNESLRIMAYKIVYTCTHVQSRRLYISQKLYDLIWATDDLLFLTFFPTISPRVGQRLYLSPEIETTARKYLREKWGLEVTGYEAAEILSEWKYPKRSEDVSLSPRYKKILKEKEKLEEWDRSQQ